MKLEKNKISRSFGTHDGTFHADEVTACALLLLFDYIDTDKIVRSRNLKELESCEYICDVGGIYDPNRKLFDHHQAEYQGPLSSAGMVLLFLKDTGRINQKEYDFFNRAVILGVDAHDNGKDPQIPGLCTYSHVIAAFTPIGHDALPNDLLTAFHQAVRFAVGFLKQIWDRYQYTLSCRQTVADAMERYRECLIFDQNIPWVEAFFELNGANHPALFVIMPSDKHWKLRGVPPSYDQRMQVRLPLPEEWAGLIGEDLKKATGIPGAIFCHKGRFISVWETREDALLALKAVLESKKVFTN